MNVLVDSSVWSLALRRRRTPIDHDYRRELHALIEEGRAAIVGPVRQEVLSGIKTREHFEQLRDHLRSFPDLALEAADHEDAAAFYSLCRARGIQGSNTDFLICAVSVRRAIPILTTDGDFPRFARVLPIALHEVRPSATRST